MKIFIVVFSLALAAAARAYEPIELPCPSQNNPVKTVKAAGLAQSAILEDPKKYKEQTKFVKDVLGFAKKLSKFAKKVPLNFGTQTSLDVSGVTMTRTPAEAREVAIAKAQIACAEILTAIPYQCGKGCELSEEKASVRFSVPVCASSCDGQVGAVCNCGVECSWAEGMGCALNCGNGRADAGEECGEHKLPAPRSGFVCEQCKLVALCGNGKLNPGEACDNGPGRYDAALGKNVGNGADCLPGAGQDSCQYCDASCRVITVKKPVCGNGNVEVGEECGEPALAHLALPAGYRCENCKKVKDIGCGVDGTLPCKTITNNCAVCEQGPTALCPSGTMGMPRCERLSYSANACKYCCGTRCAP